MLNMGYSISVEDDNELKKFKNSAAYGTYLKSIANSPAFKSIMKEHIDRIDVSDDIAVLKDQGKLPEAINAKTLSDLFKQSLSRMAICIVADTIILKELESVNIQEVLSDISADSNICYLLGKADTKYYEQANKLLEKGELEENSIGYRGLVNYLKNSGKFKDLKITKVPEISQEEKKPRKFEKKASTIDPDSNNIVL
jgi:hypothetical protein